MGWGKVLKRLRSFGGDRLLARPLFRGFVDLNVALQDVGQEFWHADSLLLSLSGKVFTDLSIETGKKTSAVEGM